MLCTERAHILRQGVDWLFFVHNMEQTKRIIPHASFSWMWRLFAISKAWNVPLDQKGCLIYSCVSMLSYIGQTGCKTGRGAVGKQFSEHLVGAALFAKGNSLKGIRKESPKYFCEAMAHIG